MRKLTPFNARFVTETYFPEEVNTPDNINLGRCFSWAYLAFVTFYGVELWDVSCHAFVKYRGKFYDSETPNGVERWQELPTISGRTIYWKGRKIKVDDFKKTWRHSCYQRFSRGWSDLNDKAKRVLSKRKP